MRRIVTVLLVGVLGGCAAPADTGASRSSPGQPLTFSITAKGSEHSGLEADSSAERTGRGAARGAAAGMGGGALLSLICGPWALGCLPIFAGSGAAAGAAGGAFYGITGLSKADAARVDAVLGPLDERRDFALELEQALRDTVPPPLRADPGNARVHVSVRVLRVELSQHAGDQLDLRLVTEMRVDAPRARHREFSESSTRHPLERWLADDGALFDEQLTLCIQRTAQRMSSTLDIGGE